jgi:hypothetical protein
MGIFTHPVQVDRIAAVLGWERTISILFEAPATGISNTLLKTETNLLAWLDIVFVPFPAAKQQHAIRIVGNLVDHFGIFGQSW